MAELARQSKTSRQTLLSIGELGARLPQIETLVKLALALCVHPMRLFHLVFEDYRLPVQHERQFKGRGDQSIFIGDVTIPDGEVVYAGTRFTKVWEVQNIGTTPWIGRYLNCMDDELVVSAGSGEQLWSFGRLRPVVDRILVPDTAPGDVVRMSVDFVAPDMPCTSISYWKSVFADGSLCFPDSLGLTCKVRVMTMRSTGAGLSAPTGKSVMP